MKTQTAKLNYFKMAPRKARLIVNLIKGLPVNEAEAQLIVSPKRISGPIAKLLRSAVANAKNTKEMDPDKLFIKEAWVDEGPVSKRFMPRAMGRACSINKKTSHITLILAESQKLKKPRFKTERVAQKRNRAGKERNKQRGKSEKRNRKGENNGGKRNQESRKEFRIYEKSFQEKKHIINQPWDTR
jgi:large subunit ribosomal protein L22